LEGLSWSKCVLPFRIIISSCGEEIETKLVIDQLAPMLLYSLVVVLLFYHDVWLLELSQRFYP
ncbi:MAG TPA: hypothetical protein VE971_05640, partial [Candidatus Eisenbacteria bacterium]|nr:hypothetical protein [Candidatus Eisenbacteria bacterium]